MTNLVLMTCCNTRYATVVDSMNHECPKPENENKCMNIAKGIKGIRKQLANPNTGWHVICDDAKIGYYDALTTIQLIEKFPGWMFLGAFGNVLSFTAK